MSERGRTWAVATAAAVAVGALAGLALPPVPAPAPPAAPTVVVSPRGPSRETVERSEVAPRATRRDAFRETLKRAGKLPFLDLSYAADPKKIQDTRWTQTDPPHPQAEEEKGMQLNAAWSASQSQGVGMTVRVHKLLHKSLDGKAEYHYTFDNAGKQVKTSDMPGMVEGFYLEWQKTMTDVVEAKCSEPKKTKVGPAKLVATVYGTNEEAQKRERRDVYGWTDTNTTWIAIIEFTDRYLDDPTILTKAKEFVGSFKELKAPD